MPNQKISIQTYYCPIITTTTVERRRNVYGKTDVAELHLGFVQQLVINLPPLALLLERC